MRAVVQRVTSASVSIEDEIVAKIDRGLCVLLGIARSDTPEDTRYLVHRILNARLFEDDTGKRWNKSVTDLGLQVLCLSQVTLNHRFKGNKPDFHTAMSPDLSKQMFHDFVQLTREHHRPDRVESGVFGAYCTVSIHNDGPVTLVIDSPPTPVSPGDHKVDKRVPDNNDSTFLHLSVFL